MFKIKNNETKEERETIEKNNLKKKRKGYLCHLLLKLFVAF